MRALAGLTLLLVAAGQARAQGVAVSASRWFSSPHATLYQVAVSGFSTGTVDFQLGGEYLRQTRAEGARWLGGTGQLLIRVTPQAQPYVVLGGSAGAGHPRLIGGYELGVGILAGAGYELIAIGPIALQAEAHYQWRSAADMRGVTIGFRLGTRLGRDVPKPPPSQEVPLPKPAPEDERVLSTVGRAPSEFAVAGAVVETALGAMGTPYRWGGTGANGFDCSGLIQYAYAQHGVTLPRTSAEQARAGREVPREAGSLQPGDILTFSDSPGSAVSHVGLYIGEGRFIHSASDGVRTSGLNANDPEGRWWYDRWVGARRVIGAP